MIIMSQSEKITTETKSPRPTEQSCEHPPLCEHPLSGVMLRLSAAAKCTAAADDQTLKLHTLQCRRAAAAVTAVVVS